MLRIVGILLIVIGLGGALWIARQSELWPNAAQPVPPVAVDAPARQPVPSDSAASDAGGAGIAPSAADQAQAAAEAAVKAAAAREAADNAGAAQSQGSTAPTGTAAAATSSPGAAAVAGAAAADDAEIGSVLTPDDYDPGKVAALIDGSRLEDGQKSALKAVLTAAEGNPALLAAALDQVRAVLK